MALNLIEDNRLIYHDEDGDTLRADAYSEEITIKTDDEAWVLADRDAVETLRDCLTRWLETGKFTGPDSTLAPEPEPAPTSEGA